MGDCRQLGRRRLGPRDPLTDRGREVLGGQRETLHPPQRPPELLTNPSGSAIQSSPRIPESSCRRRGPAATARRSSSPPRAGLLAPASDPDRESHSARRAEVRLRRESPWDAALRTSLAGRSLPSGPLPRRPDSPGAANFLPDSRRWHGAAGGPSLGEEAKRALGLVAGAEPLQPRPGLASVCQCVSEGEGEGGA